MWTLWYVHKLHNLLPVLSDLGFGSCCGLSSVALPRLSTSLLPPEDSFRPWFEVRVVEPCLRFCSCLFVRSDDLDMIKCFIVSDYLFVELSGVENEHLAVATSPPLRIQCL